MKRFLMMIAVLMILSFGCAQAPQVQEQVETEPTQEQTQTAPSEPTQEQTTEETTPTSDSTTKEFEMVSKRFAFEPNVVRVKEGDRVILHITTPDVAHGIAIPEFGVNTYLPAGETVDVEFVADQKGEFPFRCNVFCGQGHGDMKGQVVVE